MDEPRQDEAHERRKNHYRQWEEEEQAKRRSIRELSPLPRLTAPRPWEDLTTLIARTAQPSEHVIRDGCAPRSALVIKDMEGRLPPNARYHILLNTIAWMDMRKSPAALIVGPL